MLKYKMIERLANSVIYEIYPEGDVNAAARIEFFDDGTFKVIKELPPEYSNIYIGQALIGIDKNRDFGIAAWC